MFLTNQPGGAKLATTINGLLEKTTSFDMLVGFFFFSGFGTVADTLRARPETTLRVLVGMEAEKLCGRIVEAEGETTGDSANAIREAYLESLRRAMAAEGLDTAAFNERFALFVEMIRNGRLQMRRTRDPNHAKLYSFHIDEKFRLLPTLKVYWITGSSNFSLAGLKLREEVNVGVGDWGGDRAVEYFEALWEESVPLTEDPDTKTRILDILETGCVASSVTPYEAYILVLRAYVAHQTVALNMARVEEILEKAGMKPMKYQLDAVAQALAKLEAYRGCILADVVGLGKSVIASLLAALSRKRGLIICPPGLMGDPVKKDSGWWQYVRDFGLNDWQVHSRGRLDAILELLRKDPDFDIVVVDEAHAFRSRETVGYERLAQICAGRETLLLTATPFNNRPDDLYALLTLFSSGKNSPFVPGGDLDGRFRKLSGDFEKLLRLRKALSKGDWPSVEEALRACGMNDLATLHGSDMEPVRKVADRFGRRITRAIRQVMEKIVIRRNRLDLKADPEYAVELTGLSTVQPPKAQFFTLSPDQDAFYDRVVTEWFAASGGTFTGAAYRPDEYLTNQSGVRNAQQNIFHILRNILVLRFESSFGAFEGSVRNILAFLKTVKAAVDRLGFYVYARDIQEKVMDEANDHDAIALMNKLVEERLRERERSGRAAHGKDISYNVRDRKSFRGADFLRDIDSDIALLEQILVEIARLDLVQDDPKASALVETLRGVLDGSHPDIVVEGDSPRRKAIVFTAYTDTLKHLQGKLGKAFPGRVLAVSGENFGPVARNAVVADFDASREEADQRDEYDILLATDKLSEGLNLNRAGLVVNYDIPWNPTRVIQRVGRINRIGEKVFENLYIFNFFPTLKGQTYVQNKETAQAKMFAIHQILGEDAQIFSAEETPAASKLFDKLGLFPEEEEQMDIFSKLRGELARQEKWLRKNHPETLERLDKLPCRVKTAWEGEPHGTFLLRRRGPGLFAIVHNPETGKISQWALEDAIKEIGCKFDTPACAFSDDFWRGIGDDGKPKEELGVYRRLQDYRAEAKMPQGGASPNALARANIGRFRKDLPPDLSDFAGDLETDLREYLTLPPKTVGSLAANFETAAEFCEVLRRIFSRYRPGHFAALRARLGTDEIIATVQKN